MVEFTLPIDILEQRFQSFLKRENNERIFFSGKFGAGKTKFLRSLFETNSAVYHLFPVNYSVASNDDIFELLKFDIALELLQDTRKINFDKNEFSKSLKLQTFLYHDTPNIIQGLLKYISKIGKPLEIILNKLIEIEKSYKEFAEYNEEERIVQFINDYKKLSSHSHEDPITNLIKNKIENLTTESILILDDLDRIDPEHLFRILNVFAAHFDKTGHGNKFGFDKVILVADIDNIKNIFHHRYGTKSDFKGYIDKFHTNEIFKFSLRDEIQKVSENVCQSILFNSRKTLKRFGQINHTFYHFFEFLITNAISLDLLTPRSIKNNSDFNIDIQYYNRITNDYRYSPLNLIMALREFKKVLGDNISLITFFKELIDTRNYILNAEFIKDEETLSILLTIASCDQHNLMQFQGIQNRTLQIDNIRLNITQEWEGKDLSSKLTNNNINGKQILHLLSKANSYLMKQDLL